LTVIEATAIDAEGDALLYRWVEGETVLLDWTAVGANGEAYLDLGTVPPLAAGDHVLTLEVMDATSTVSSEMILTIAANTPPVQDAGEDQSVHPGTGVTLDGSASFDPDAHYPLSYSWQIASKPEGSTAELLDPETVSPTLEPDVLGIYEIELVVTDNLGVQSLPDIVLVSTYNTAPVADAADDQAVIELGTEVQLDATQSWDDDGDGFAYWWTITQKPAGSAAALDDPCSAMPTFFADVHGEYTVTVTVTDDFGAVSDPDTVVVSFDNVQPVADAGDGQAAIVGQTVSLNGSASYDGNLDVLTYEWDFVLRPAGSQAQLSNPSSVEASFAPDEPGTYIVSLVVYDGFEYSEPDNATIEVISTQDAAVGTLFDLIEAIRGLDDVSLKNKNMKKALINKINAVLNKIERGLYEEALDKLQNDILKKTDGCAETGAPDKNDWIIVCEGGQNAIYPLVVEAIGLLETLI
jgi:hypothetical protein